MNAFVRTENGLFKVYRHGSDWQVVGPQFERWSSVWSNDVLGSLMRAVDAIPGTERTIEIIKLS